MKFFHMGTWTKRCRSDCDRNRVEKKKEGERRRVSSDLVETIQKRSKFKWLIDSEIGLRYLTPEIEPQKS